MREAKCGLTCLEIAFEKHEKNNIFKCSGEHPKLYESSKLKGAIYILVNRHALRYARHLSRTGDKEGKGWEGSAVVADL